MKKFSPTRIIKLVHETSFDSILDIAVYRHLLEVDAEMRHNVVPTQ